MTELPAGTVTFLFTDIEGSTARWERHPQEMGEALGLHNEILRAAIKESGGMVYETAGDSFLAVFTLAPEALATTLSAQRKLRAVPWREPIGELRVRMALHTGPAELRTDGVYAQHTLSRLARVLAAGYGGQILITRATYELVRDSLPEGVALLDLGEHRLKDLVRPEQIFQVVADDLPSDFPPIRGLDMRPNNLPRQTTALIGREKENAEVGALVRRPDVALVTLIGPGGTGKTRLALQAGAELLDEFTSGVFFVDLSPVVDADLVIPAIAQALTVNEAAGEPLTETLKGYLRDRSMLLVLDNFEQVTAAAKQVSELLRTCPHLKILVTSRVALRLRGEHEYAVPPLALPDPRQLPQVEKLTQYESVRLFIERAQAVKADFQVTNVNAPAVAEICVRLDGLPLAIELAAARARILTPEAMLARLDNRLKLLTSGSRDLPARQQTLRGAIDWSYDLLNEEERALFRHFSIFSGGATLEAVEAVCQLGIGAVHSDLQSLDSVDVLESLVSKSLLTQIDDEAGDSSPAAHRRTEPRFRMLETIHEYAQERLEESGEDRDAGEEHTRYFLALAEEADKGMRAGDQSAWLRRVEREYDNMRAALRRLRRTKDRRTKDEDGQYAIEALRLCAGLGQFWLLRGYYGEGMEWLQWALAAGGDAQSPLRAKALNYAGYLAWILGNYKQALDLYGESLKVCEALGDRSGMARALHGLSSVAGDQGDFDAVQRFSTKGLEIYRELGDKRGIATSLSRLGDVAASQGDYAAAQAMIQESLDLDIAAGNQSGVAWTLVSLGLLQRFQNRPGDARRLAGEALERHTELGNKLGMAASLNGLGYIAEDLGEFGQAAALHERALILQNEIGDKYGIAISQHALGRLMYRDGNLDGAWRLYAQSLKVLLELENREELAVCLDDLAALAASMDDGRRAARLLGAAAALRAAIHTTIPPADRPEYERNLAAAHTALSDVEWQAEWSQGEAMSMEDAVAYALEV